MSTNKTRLTLYPEYVNEFSCIGPECEDTCCAGWNIYVDKEAYKKYQRVKDPQLQKKIKETIKRNRTGKTDNEYGKMALDDNGVCGFLDVNKLCTIHKELGEDYLCNTCFEYPKVFTSVLGTVEKSLSMSCPEAARKALLNKDKMQFVQEVEMKNVRGTVGNKIMKHFQKEIFWDLRIFIIGLMQDRNYTVEQRLIILGLFLNRLENTPDEEMQGELPSLTEVFTKYLNDSSIISNIENLPKKVSFQISVAEELLKYRINLKDTSKLYIECAQEAIKGLQLDELHTLEERENIYNECYEKYYKPFMDEHEYILENYIVDYVFSKTFPMDERTLTSSYMMLIIHFMLIKLYLIGMAGYHKGLSEEHVIKLITSMSRMVSHNNVYLKTVRKVMEEAGYMSLAHMVVLVKS